MDFLFGRWIISAKTCPFALILSFSLHYLTLLWFSTQMGASQSDIESAAKQAAAHDFIMAFPKGYQTEVCSC